MAYKPNYGSPNYVYYPVKIEKIEEHHDFDDVVVLYYGNGRYFNLYKRDFYEFLEKTIDINILKNLCIETREKFVKRMQYYSPREIEYLNKVLANKPFLVASSADFDFSAYKGRPILSIKGVTHLSINGTLLCQTMGLFDKFVGEENVNELAN